MKKTNYLCLLLVALVAGVVANPSHADAAIHAYGHLGVSDFGILIDKGEGAGFEEADVSDFVAGTVTPFTTSTTGAALIPGGGDADFAFGSFDAPQASVPGIIVPENTFTPTAFGSAPFARADTGGTGALISGLGDPFGATVDTVAEVQLDPTINQGGLSSGEVITNSGFSFTTDDTWEFSARFDALLLLIAAIDVPPGITTTATSAFSISLSQTDALGNSTPLLVWTPNGSVAGGVQNPGGLTINLVDEAFNMSQSVSRTVGSGTGTTTISQTGDFRLDFILGPGTYELSLNHETNANALVQNAIPEPASMLIWGGIASALGLGGMIRRRKK